MTYYNPGDPELQTNPNYRCCCGSTNIVTGAKILMVITAIFSVVRFGGSFLNDMDTKYRWAFGCSALLGLICIGLCWYGIEQGSAGLTIPYLVILCISAVVSMVIAIIWGITIGEFVALPLIYMIAFLLDVVYIIYCACCINSLRNFLSDWQKRNPLPAVAMLPMIAQPWVMQPMGGQPGAMQPMSGQPGAMKPMGGQPGAMQPMGGHPEAMQPTGGSPGVMQPMDGQPRVTQPMGGQPGAMQPMGGLPGVMQSTGGSPVYSQETPYPAEMPETPPPYTEE